MGKIKFTDEQKEIINERGDNILVSAAAGSGKTAVLVERIFKRVMDENEPVDIDKFVVVTFTNAAAAQMKDKLTKRFEQELEKKPNDARLRRQVGLLSGAHISTVHSFCIYVIRNYFHRIGIDPGFRLTNQSEINLIREEVFLEQLERAFEKGDKSFIELASLSIFNKGNEELKKAVFSIVDKASNFPSPNLWFEEAIELINISTIEELENSFFIKEIVKLGKTIIEENVLECEKMLEELKFIDFDDFRRLIEESKSIYENMLTKNTYDEIIDVINACSISNWVRKNKVPEEYQEISDNLNKRRKALKEKFSLKNGVFAGLFSQKLKYHLQDIKDLRKTLQPLLEFSMEFNTEYVNARRERGVVNFDDLQHLAIEILVTYNKETRCYEKTEAAKELSKNIVEIMIDEYQDSNPIQDLILESVSSSKDGIVPSNIFMVGDVKQSIYSFRNACPELFSQKLDLYKEKDKPGKRLDLHMNFRSRETILEGTNAVFDKIMKKDIGGVEYDEDARLEYGAKKTYIPTDKKVGGPIELSILQERYDTTLEAKNAACYINDIVEKNPLYVLDDEKYRKATYKDIVILVGKNKYVDGYFVEELYKAGIPVVNDKRDGFFETSEINLMISMLNVLDNPRQDIPLATVLLSSMFGFTESDLVAIKKYNDNLDLYGALMSYDVADSIGEKINTFVGVIEKIRDKISYATVVEIIKDIYECTGIYEAIMSGPESNQRTANMDALMEHARQFDEGCFKGLYQFVAYLKEIKSVEEEFSEVNVLGEDEDVVKVTTIHKSKGLEYPIVIVVGIGESLAANNSDKMKYGKDGGVSFDIIDMKTKTKRTPLLSKYFSYRKKVDELGEKMRLLYVAMTRAKEKLILIASVKDGELKKSYDYQSRINIKTFFDMLGAATEDEKNFIISEKSKFEVLDEYSKIFSLDQEKTETYYKIDTDRIYDVNMKSLLETADIKKVIDSDLVPVKISVSDIKEDVLQNIEQEDFVSFWEMEKEIKKPVPEFIETKEEKEDKFKGARYGTAWHQVMATIDFTRTESVEMIKEEVDCLVNSGKLNSSDRHFINEKKLKIFFDSRLGKMMIDSYVSNTLKREQPFVIKKRYCDLFLDDYREQSIMVQGIIDACFEYEKKLYLMDYKTDRLLEGNEIVLIDRYKKQMELYKEALEKMLRKPVYEIILYSFSLGKEIIVKL